MGRERLEIEFGLYSEWLADAIEGLGIDPIRAGCRGTGNPALFEMLCNRAGLGPGMRVLDVGCGIGSPGAWLQENRDCEVIGVDVMERGVRGLKRLFPHSNAFVGSLRSLPLGRNSFDAAWALGVIETIDDKTSALREVWRVLRSRTSLAVYSYAATGDAPLDAPTADRFESPASIVAKLEGAGFSVEAEPASGLPPVPNEWKSQSAAAREEVRRRHGDDERMRVFESESQKIGRLIQEKAIEPWIFVSTKED